MLSSIIDNSLYAMQNYTVSHYTKYNAGKIAGSYFLEPERINPKGTTFSLPQFNKVVGADLFGFFILGRANEHLPTEHKYSIEIIENIAITQIQLTKNNYKNLDTLKGAFLGFYTSYFLQPLADNLTARIANVTEPYIENIKIQCQPIHQSLQEKSDSLYESINKYIPNKVIDNLIIGYKIGVTDNHVRLVTDFFNEASVVTDVIEKLPNPSFFSSYFSRLVDTSSFNSSFNFFLEAPTYLNTFLLAPVSLIKILGQKNKINIIKTELAIPGLFALTYAAADILVNDVVAPAIKYGYHTLIGENSEVEQLGHEEL